jgi:hypothetical protein
LGGLVAGIIFALINNYVLIKNIWKR